MLFHNEPKRRQANGSNQESENSKSLPIQQSEPQVEDNRDCMVVASAVKDTAETRQEPE